MKRALSLILSIILVFSIIPAGVITVAASAETTGTTGQCTWTRTGTVVTISGEGAMGNYNNTNNCSPWGKDITEVIIENGVTSIGSYAFYRCTALKSISIPSGLKSFENNAFYYCNSLSGIVIPDGVTSIGSEAFYNCSKISEVVLPDSVISIGDDAFALCRFTSIRIPENVSSIGAGALGYCSLLTNIEVDENNPTYYSANNCIIKKSTNALVAGCKSSVIPDGVTSIEDDAFHGCSAYVNIAIPDGVTKIGKYAFAGSDYTSITIPKSVTDIAYGAFYLCSFLNDVYYSGNKVDKAKITIAGSNEDLTAANWHYAPCENDAHAYNYDCTTICKNCDYVRTTAKSHIFDNDCDEVCNVCGEHRKGYHIYEQLGENTAKCMVCNLSKTFDFIITTDETITLSYETTKKFDFSIEDTSVAKITNISSSVISSGSYYRQSSSAKISPVYLGDTSVKVVDENGTILTTSTLLVVEGDHQMQVTEIYTVATCTQDGRELHTCKFCGHQEEITKNATGHTEIVDPAIAPTCVNTGLTEGKHCEICNEVFIAQTELPATGEHLWKKTKTNYQNGDVTYTCETCVATYTKKLLSIEITKLPNVLEYYEHAYNGRVDSTGMVVVAYYDDNTSETVQYSSMSWSGPYPGKNTVTVTYYGKKDTFEILYYCSNHNIQPGTCVSDAYCKWCGMVFENTTNLDNHEVCTEKITPATFTKKGYTTYTCCACKAKFKGKYVAAKGLSAPSVKIANDAKTGKPTVSWKAVSEASSYVVYRATSKTGRYTKLATTTKTSYTDSSASLGKTYYYKVIAVCASDSKLNSTYSNVVSAAAKCGQPTIKIKQNSKKQPVISWGKVSGAKKYDVYYATSKNGTYKKLTSTSKTSYTHTKASAGKEYYYKVRAYSISSTTGVFSAVSQSVVKLATPKLTVTTKNGQATIKWKKITGATKYELQCSVSGGAYKTIATVSGTSYTHKGLAGGNKYTYRLRAVSSVKDAASAYSSVKSVSIKCAAPTISVSLSGNKPVIKWSKVSGAAKYQVYYATSKSGKYKLVGTVTGTSYTHSGAPAAKACYYKVLAVDKNGTKGAYSSVKSITTKCAAPTAVKVKLNNKKQPVITWSKVSGAKKYEVYVATSKNGTYKKLTSTSKLTYTYTKAKTGTTYYFKVTAYGSSTSSRSSYSAIVKTP